MIVLTKMNHERFLINHLQIECIEVIPESKIVMMNHDYYLVRETPDHHRRPPGKRLAGAIELTRCDKKSRTEANKGR